MPNQRRSFFARQPAVTRLALGRQGRAHGPAVKAFFRIVVDRGPKYGLNPPPSLGPIFRLSACWGLQFTPPALAGSDLARSSPLTHRQPRHQRRSLQLP
jgi:hypothetical protein